MRRTVRVGCAAAQQFLLHRRLRLRRHVGDDVRVDKIVC